MTLFDDIRRAAASLAAELDHIVHRLHERPDVLLMTVAIVGFVVGHITFEVAVVMLLAAIHVAVLEADR